MSTQRRATAAIVRAMRNQLMIAAGEGSAAAYFLALFFLLGAGFALGRGSAGTLFLQRFGIEYLPQVFVALSLCIAGASVAYAAIADRLRPDRLLVILLAMLCAGLLPLWFAMGWSDLAQSYPAYFVVFHAASEILLLQITLYFGMSFDNSQSKRLLPIALAGMQAGEMCGGLGLTLLASRLPMHHVTMLWCLLLALAAGLVMFRHRQGRRGPHARPTRKSTRPWRAAGAQLSQGLRFTRSSPLLRNIALATLFTVIGMQVLEYCTLVIYADSFRSEAELGMLFGILTFLCGAITLLIQLFFSARMLRTYGVRAMNLVLPISLIAVFIGLVASFRLPAALAGSIVQRTLLPAMRNPSRALLFQALPDHMQGRARALSLAVVVPAGILLAAFIVRAVPVDSQAWLLPLIGLAAAGGYFGYSIATNANYPATLLDTLGEKLFVARGQLGRLDPVRDHALLDKLVEGVRHPQEAVAVAYCQALAQAFPADAWRYVLERARGASIAVQDQLIQLVAAHLPDSQRHVLRGFLDTADDHQRCTVLSTLFASRDPDAQAWVERCLTSGNPRLAACGIQGAHAYPLDALLPQARARWQALLGSRATSELIAGLDLARARPERDWLALILRAYEHPEERVRQAALAALDRHAAIAGGGLAAWVRKFIGSTNPEERATALRCAVDLPQGERLAQAYAALNDPHPRVSAAVVGLLADHHGAEFSAVASDWLANDSLPVRAQRVLLHWLLANSVSARRIAGYAMRRAEAALALSATLQRLRRAGPADCDPSVYTLLTTALEESAVECADLALLSMECIDDRTTLRRVRAAVTSADMRHYARAVEALEGLRNRDIAQALRRTLENVRGDAPFDTGTGGMRESFAQIVDYLSQYPDAFLRECAQYAQRAPREAAR